MKLLAHRFLVEDTEHRIFAVDRRHDGNTEVDRTLGVTVLHAETAVLRNTALRDVQLAHHLDTGDDRSVMFASDRRHGLRQHAVNAKLDAD